MSNTQPDAPPDTPAATATAVFLAHRELLFSIVYNMLGSVADTEDVLQETRLAWAPRTQAPRAEPIDHPRAYLVRIAVHQALARQDAIRRAPQGLGVRYRQVNGDPAALLFAGDAPFAVIVLDLTPDGEQVCGIYTVTNPDKLAHVD